MTELLDKFQESGAKERAIDSMPSRIKYYLLEWKDRNYDAFVAKFGSVSLGSLSREQLIELFKDASTSDFELMIL